MLNRIFVGLAILASIFVAAFGYFSVKPKIDTIVQQRDTEKKEKLDTQEKLRKTERDLKNTRDNLKNTEDRLKTTTEEKNRVVADLNRQKAELDRTKEELKDKTDKLGEALAKIFIWDQLGITPDQIKTMIQQNKDLLAAREELNTVIATLTRKNKQLDSKINELINTQHVVLLPEGLRGKVLAVDPKWEFVVLNFGANQGALENGELLVHRNGQPVAMVRIKSLKPDSCIANVVSGYRLHEILEGDAVFPAHN
jgi:hypothetical protein